MFVIPWDIIGGMGGGGLLIGFILTGAMDFLEKRRALRKARLEAGDLLHKSEENEEKLLEQKLKSLKEKEEKLKEDFKITIKTAQKHLSELQSKTDKATYELKLKKKECQKTLNKMRSESEDLKKQELLLSKNLLDITAKQDETQKNFLKALKQRFSFDLEEIKEILKKNMLEIYTAQALRQTEKWEKEQKHNLEKNALFYLHFALNRFSTPYCSEKGIESVSFSSKKQMQKTIGPDRIRLNKLEAACGVDVVVYEQELKASILGIDPVRRELGRITLQKLSRMRSIHEGLIKSIARKSKKELFEKIQKDGGTLCHRLGLKNIAQAVRNMMGSLRYRYSFAQNQHFHCEEVGWLCGLLSSELQLPLWKARKAGFLHDIGKAMDHSIEGNHAVIGADFIEKHGLEEDVVHAVKAHHHDVTPSTALAFLVIAADAISGSRPGARRFTEDSYAKKMAQLEQIADSFSNIKDAYIMNAGREMRIIVDNENVSDKEALTLSQQVARKIERECAYPGLIKVTVVRHNEVATTIQ